MTTLELKNKGIVSESHSRRDKIRSPISDADTKRFNAVVDKLKPGDLFWVDREWGIIGKFKGRDTQLHWKIHFTQFDFDAPTEEECYFYQVMRPVTKEELAEIRELYLSHLKFLNA